MSVTAAEGFRAAGVRAGLKASGRPDLALVVNDGPLDVAAGVFTTNRIVSAPVIWSRGVIAGERGGSGSARAVPGVPRTRPPPPSASPAFWLIAVSRSGMFWCAPRASSVSRSTCRRSRRESPRRCAS